MAKTRTDPTDARTAIARKVKALRRARGLTQRHLAELLNLSQSRLSEIESGQGSFSAEQFLQILRFFNVQVSHFDEGGRDPSASLQKALARLGATHLVEDPGLLPSEHLDQADAVIREILVEGGPARSMTALAPVLVSQIYRVNLNKLFAQMKDYGLECRFGWLVENVLLAVQGACEQELPRPFATQLRKAEAVLQNFHGWLLAHIELDRQMTPDTLGMPILSARTRIELTSEASAPSTRWNILTSIQVGDFTKAILESHVP